MNIDPELVDVQRLAGADAHPDEPADLLVEIAHGATRRADYDRAAARLRGPLPADLHEFFHVNTDVGAPELGHRVAELLLERQPRRKAVIARCLVPRTFVDVNRTPEVEAGDLREGGVTAAIPPYVTDAADLQWLRDAHRRYTETLDTLWAEIVGAGGLGLAPHSYGPVSIQIAGITPTVIEDLRAAYAPEQFARWPMRPEVDLITRTPDGEPASLVDAEDALVAAYAAVGLTAAVCGCYTMVPGTMAAVRASQYPDQVLCWEVRRDLLVERWLWNQEMTACADKIERAATPVVDYLDRWLMDRGR